MRVFQVSEEQLRKYIHTAAVIGRDDRVVPTAQELDMIMEVELAMGSISEVRND